MSTEQNVPRVHLHWGLIGSSVDWATTGQLEQGGSGLIPFELHGADITHVTGETLLTFLAEVVSLLPQLRHRAVRTSHANGLVPLEVLVRVDPDQPLRQLSENDSFAVSEIPHYIFYCGFSPPPRRRKVPRLPRRMRFWPQWAKRHRCPLQQWPVGSLRV